MPFYKEIILDSNARIGLWKIDETDPVPLLSDSTQYRLAIMKSEIQKRSLLAVRLLLEHYNYSDLILSSDENGKPLLFDGTSISISHSKNFAAVYLGKENVGVDIENLGERVLKARPYFVEENEVQDINNIEELTLHWAVKEAIFKISNTRNLNFRTDLHLLNYAEGKGKARSTFADWNKEFNFNYERVEDNLLAWATFVP